MNSVTIEDIEAAIAEEGHYKVGHKTAVVVLVLHNGFEILGSSACVDPANYDHEIGRKIAREDAINKLWAFLGFSLQDRLYLEKKRQHG
jgi:hypothetical protein